MEETQVRTKRQFTAGQLRKRRNRRNALLRAGIQLIFFVTMPGAFVAGFNGVKAIFQRIGAGETLQWNSFIAALLLRLRLRLRIVWGFHLLAVRADPEKAVPAQKTVPPAGETVPMAQQGEIRDTRRHRDTLRSGGV
jgi:hypothetical protein